MVQFVIDGQVIKTSRAQSQRTIIRILNTLASANPGKDVHVLYT